MIFTSPIQFPGLGLELNPPQGFTIGPLTVNLYGVCIALGLLLAVLYGCRRSKQFGIKQDDILDGVLIIVPIAVVFARLYYCVFEWDLYKDDPITVLYIWKGGLAIYGGIIGAVLGLVTFCKVKKIKLPALLDLVALGFLIGQCIGRWGNFFNREAFGAETESFLRMGLMMYSNRVPSYVMHYYHPTFLYESLWNLAGFILLHFLSKKRRYDGQIALGYVAWYGLGRTFIEALRTDSLIFLGMRVSQVLAAVSCFVAVILLLVLSFKKHPASKLYVNQVAALAAEEEGEEEEDEEEGDEEEGDEEEGDDEEGDDEEGEEEETVEVTEDP